MGRYFAASPASLAALAAPTGEPPRAPAARARRFVKQYDLQAWVRHENEAKGLAPTTGLVQRQVLLSGTTAVAANPHGDIAEESLSPPSTKWVQRFRRRWALRRGAFPPRAAPPLHVLRQRAGGGRKCSTPARCARLLCAPCSATGAEIRPPKQGPPYIFVQWLGPEGGPPFSAGGQAFLCWRWWKLYVGYAAAGKRGVGLNMQRVDADVPRRRRRAQHDAPQELCSCTFCLSCMPWHMFGQHFAFTPCLIACCSSSMQRRCQSLLAKLLGQHMFHVVIRTGASGTSVPED